MEKHCLVDHWGSNLQPFGVQGDALAKQAALPLNLDFVTSLLLLGLCQVSSDTTLMLLSVPHPPQMRTPTPRLSTSGPTTPPSRW